MGAAARIGTSYNVPTSALNYGGRQAICNLLNLSRPAVTCKYLFRTRAHTRTHTRVNVFIARNYSVFFVNGTMNKTNESLAVHLFLDIKVVGGSFLSYVTFIDELHFYNWNKVRRTPKVTRTAFLASLNC